MIHVRDWRLSTPAEIEPLLALEREAWLRDLDWDVCEAWHAVEPARHAGTLAGFVATDEPGHIVGWTSFLLHRDNVQVLAFVAPAVSTASALLDAILESDERAAADTVLFCVRSAADSLPNALAARGFRVEPYRYLAVDLDGYDRCDGYDRSKEGTGAVNFLSSRESLRPWSADGQRLARLFARAYEGNLTTRAFAPHGSAAEWTEYVVTLLTTTGCGRFVPGLSFVVPSARSNELAGAVVVTELAPGTSHVAQIAVDQAERGRGLGRLLLTGAMSAAASAGCARMTLLVAASNRAALALYERAGFRHRSSFVVARAGRDELSTNVALAADGRSASR
jgi:ribosomal protein S18 acetylase RimI-like enzyme